MKNQYEIFFDNVSFSYRRNRILENVNLSVSTGEFASIVGPNGGGKTTLLKLILGLLKPDEGTVYVFGKPAGENAVKIGYMPQDAHLDLAFPATVMDVVLMGRLSRKRLWFSREDKRLAMASIGEVGLTDFMHTSFNELSGGQRQRTLIARAMCSQPGLLLLDELTANVDQKTEINLFSLLQKLNEHVTILLVSHDTGFVSKYVKSVICVNKNVVIHPTSVINGTVINDIYKNDMKMVRHDHRCGEKGYTYE